MDTIQEALTFDDVLLLPRYSSILPSKTNISLDLTEKISLKVPFFSGLCTSFNLFKKSFEAFINFTFSLYFF